MSAAWLGLLYQIPQYHNYAKDFVYCTHVAECGISTAKFVLGMMYLIGKGCDADIEKAYLWLKKAKKDGITEATIFLDQINKINS